MMYFIGSNGAPGQKGQKGERGFQGVPGNAGNMYMLIISVNVFVKYKMAI